MTTTIIGTETFDFLFMLFVLIIGLDYTLMGWMTFTGGVLLTFANALVLFEYLMKKY